MRELQFIDFNTAIGVFHHPDLGDGVWVTDLATYDLFKRAYKLTNEPIQAKYKGKTLYFLWASRKGLSENKNLTK